MINQEHKDPVKKVKFWSMENPFWDGFFDGLSMMWLWRFIWKLTRRLFK